MTEEYVKLSVERYDELKQSEKLAKMFVANPPASFRIYNNVGMFETDKYFISDTPTEDILKDMLLIKNYLSSQEDTNKKTSILNIIKKWA